MQARFTIKAINSQDGYLTVYLSLIFGIVLSLVLTLVEGAALGASRAQAELVADLGMDSAFAEYHREILNQYELFFLDTSYGEADGGLGSTQEHLLDYMEYNMTPKKEMNMGGCSLLTLENVQLNINEVSFATDDNAAAWKVQAVNYMKSVYGGDLVSTVKGYVDVVNGNQMAVRDIKGEVSENKAAFEEALKENEIIEYTGETEGGNSYSQITDVFDSITGSGLLSIVMPSGKTISGTSVDTSKYFTSRKNAGNVNKGIGLHEGVSKADGIDDEIIFNEYLMKMYGNYANPKEEGHLDYQIEYILYGKDSDEANLRECVEKIYAIRAVSNMLYLMSDSWKYNEVHSLALAICTILLVPQLADVLTLIILGIWALAEAIVDVRSLLNGEKVPLLKSSSDWNLDLGSLLSFDFLRTGGNSHGLEYQDYLRVLLALQNPEEKVNRSLDIVEMDIRATDGNENFRIDRCIDYMEVNFGFVDTRGREFVFDKKMCYE